MKTSRLIGINRHSIGMDGSGITTLVLFHGCPLHCKYCLNPQALSAKGMWKRLTPEALYTEISRDDLYFRATAGGVTFGGGEPLLSYRQILHFHQLCIANGNRWKLNIETSLNVPTVMVKALENIVDQWIVDIKDMNPTIYQAYTGRDNALVIQNLQHLLDTKADITARVPLIPMYNTEEDVEKSTALLRKMGVSQIDKFKYIIKTH